MLSPKMLSRSQKNLGLIHRTLSRLIRKFSTSETPTVYEKLLEFYREYSTLQLSATNYMLRFLAMDVFTHMDMLEFATLESSMFRLYRTLLDGQRLIYRRLQKKKHGQITSLNNVQLYNVDRFIKITD